ncbi:MAG TPA: TauD/TfdA family dioxygenase [Labilithrix sp.]|nr:TauD/TfdA family dioxygenase [Labilithrix sp.]
MNIPRFAHAESHLWDKEGEFILFVKALDSNKCGSIEWFIEHRDAILKAMDRFGVVFFRGFPVDSRGFEAIVDELAPEPLPYLGGVSPRAFVHGTVYTASESPQTLAIVQHHEMSYHSYSPRYVAFYCQTPAASGGATTISDGRAFGRMMDSAARRVMDELNEKGVLFVRNYNQYNSKSWKDTWHTSDKAELEQMLRAATAEWEWVEGDWLRTRQTKPALIRDPLSGARVVFSSINIWQRKFSSNISEAYALPLWGEEGSQPYQSFFGDGTPIPEEFIDLMHKTHDGQLVNIPWQPRDFMLINNFVGAHGKERWQGTTREIFVTLREKVDITRLARSRGTPEAPLHG